MHCCAALASIRFASITIATFTRKRQLFNAASAAILSAPYVFADWDTPDRINAACGKLDVTV